MKWEKIGMIFNATGQHGILNSHAQVPTLLLKGDILRIYFSYRPHAGLSLTTYVDVSADNPSKILYVHNKPILEQGRPGTFDEHGIMPSSLVKKDGLLYLYYSGWQKSVGVPYNNYTGLAISSDDGETFKKQAEGPVLDRTMQELFSATSPLVLFENGKWHCWYSSGTNWHNVNGKLEHTYDLKYAESADGISWDQNGIVAIKQKDPYEAITRPAVLKDKNGYHMWYSYRGTENFRNAGTSSYRLGYAFSTDLLSWQRMDDQAGIDLSPDGWDSKMMAYPSIITIKEKTFLFYNGNDFGQSGIGYAQLI